LRKEQVYNEYLEIKKKVWPEAIISNTYDMLLIPRVPLPPKFNLPYTPLLIVIDYYNDYLPPSAYVTRKLRIYGRKSSHLAEELTELYMLEKGWVKLCYKIIGKWQGGLKNFVLMALKFLEGLED